MICKYLSILHFLVKTELFVTADVISSEPEFDFMECTPLEVETDTSDVTDLLPTKSSLVYQAAYKKFIKWCEGKKITNYSESVLLAYFSELANKMKMKGSTMWTQYSMIRTLLGIKNGIDISKYLKLRAYLKKQNEGYTPKKSRGLTRQQFEKFLAEASDEKYLGIKASFIRYFDSSRNLILISLFRLFW